MTIDRQKTGKTGESMAIKFLKKKGYKILVRNYRNAMGEIDIIAKHKKAIVFIEVKSRNTPFYGNPKFAVTLKKQRKISMVALSYLKETGQFQTKARFDVVSITLMEEPPEIELIQNAFDLAYG